MYQVVELKERRNSELRELRIMLGWRLRGRVQRGAVEERLLTLRDYEMKGMNPNDAEERNSSINVIATNSKERHY